jgi:hypothetical protein
MSTTACRLGDAQHFAHVARVGLDRADRVDLVEAAEDAAHVGVLHFAHQDVGRAHVDAQDVGEVRFRFERDEIVIRRHHAQLGDIGDRMAGLDGDHQRIDLADAVGEPDAVAFLQQPAKIVFELGRIQLVAGTGEAERCGHGIRPG